MADNSPRPLTPAEIFDYHATKIEVDYKRDLTSTHQPEAFVDTRYQAMVDAHNRLLLSLRQSMPELQSVQPLNRDTVRSQAHAYMHKVAEQRDLEIQQNFAAGYGY